jgi:regulation of enolase protein 1 (concanavalin A-like superfamily)
VTITIESLPFALSWHVEPVEFRAGSNSLVAEAGSETDLFVDPGTRAAHRNAPRLVGQVAGDFRLAARVSVDFRSTFDAGALLIWATDQSWAKLCFELSPQGEQTVVSVVTRAVSDDCNSFATERDEMWLRLARLGPAFAFHASTDGRRWGLIRHFGLETAAEVLAGFVVQSPRGPGCVARFEEISFVPARLADIRSGE